MNNIIDTIFGSLGQFFIGLFGAMIVLSILVPIFFGIARMLGLYTIVEEGKCQVFVLFGKTIGILREPGLYILPIKLGPNAFLVGWLGQKHELDMRLDQRYLRSQAVNSEEGAPMGIGVWYEMFISDPVAYLFRNADPQGSLAANVGSAVVRTLSNLPLERMLEDRHTMSRSVREEVSPKSEEWGYKLGSVYTRKVHFRDGMMIAQIEAKVVNRLRQVTSAIKQAGANQVSVITSTAERQAAVEFAKAQAIRPHIVGDALHTISADAEVAEALFEILEYQRMAEANTDITLVPTGTPMLAKLIATDMTSKPPVKG